MGPTCPCVLCLALSRRVAELEEEVRDVRRYAGRLHDQVHRDAEELLKLKERPDGPQANQ